MSCKHQPLCTASKAERLAWQGSHHPDFDRSDLWENLCMNTAGVFVYGFDDEEEAKAYAAYFNRKRHRRELTIVKLDEALKMKLPPTWSHNWDYSDKWEFPAELEKKFGQHGDILVSPNGAVVIR